LAWGDINIAKGNALGLGLGMTKIPLNGGNFMPVLSIKVLNASPNTLSRGE